MEYPFTEEQLAMSDLVNDFMEKEVAPVAAEMDRSPDPKDCYPAELINKASKLGIRTMAVPEEWGGAGADTTTKALCLWRGAQTEVGVIKCLSQCWKISTAIAKRGTEAMVQGFAREGAPDGILVNGVRLGYIRSGFHQRWHGRTEQQMAERADLVPLKRGGEPEEAAALFIYLLSGWASFMTGQMLALTGGDWL